MTAKLTNRLLKKASRIANEHAAIQQELTDAFNERYGCTYSDIDADEIIDVLDYGGTNGITLKKCDEIMSAGGSPPHTSTDRAGGGA